MAEGQRVFVLWGLLAAACATHASPAGHTRVVTTSDAAATGPTVQGFTRPLEAGDALHTGEEQASVHAPLDLREFRPLLSVPELSAVRKAVMDERAEDAVKLLEGAMNARKLEGDDLLRHEFLLGLLRRQAGQRQQALVAFQAAAKQDWILRDDARLYVAELELEEERPQRALETLHLLGTLGQTPRALGIEAKALASLGEHGDAASAWQRLLDRAPSSAARLERALSLIALAEGLPEGAERVQRATEAASEAHKARLGLSAEEPLVADALDVERRATRLGASHPALPDVEQQLEHLRGLADSRKWEELYDAALTVKLPSGAQWLHARCELEYFKAKALAGKREWGQAADRLRGPVDTCRSEGELHAWILFNAGKYSAADGRNMQAATHYAELEKLYPKNTLADDARLRAAKAYEEVGARARFVELLSSMPDDYPAGDMTMEGVLLLALSQMEKHDYSGAAAVLGRAANVVRKTDSSRGHEYAGTERYFLARCQEQLGQEEEALAEYSSIIAEVPLSYYMLHAYSRLLEADPKRAAQALSEGLERAKSSPFEFPYRPEYKSWEFRRGMELLRVGETERGQQAISALGLGPEADDSLLWGVALLYDRAGEAHEAHGIARGRLTDWLSHYPEGDWKSPWEIGFPRPYHAIVRRESTQTQVPEWFIYGIMREESTFLPRVVSHANAYGLMQIIPSTARGIGKKAGLPYSTAALKRPAVNIAIGSRVLEELGRRFKTNPWLAIPGYNAGPGRPSQWLRERPNIDFDIWVEMIPFRETRRYTKRVLASRAAYAFLYYRETAQTALVLPKRLNSP